MVHINRRDHIEAVRQDAKTRFRRHGRMRFRFQRQEPVVGYEFELCSEPPWINDVVAGDARCCRHLAAVAMYHKKVERSSEKRNAKSDHPRFI